MANRERGEVPLTIEGKAYTLVMNTNAMIALQDACSAGKAIASLEEIYAAVMAGSVRHIRAFLWAALQKYHPGLTLDAVGELIDAAGGIVGMSALLQQVQKASEPDAADVRELQPRAGNPRKARGAA